MNSSISCVQGCTIDIFLTSERAISEVSFKLSRFFANVEASGGQSSSCDVSRRSNVLRKTFLVYSVQRIILEENAIHVKSLSE